MVDLVRSQRAAHNMIARWGGGVNKGNLVRAGVRRPCTIVRIEYKPTERGLYLDGSNKFAVSAYGLAVPPDHELDLVEANHMRYRIIQPPGGPRPSGLVIFYELICMFQERF